MMWSVILVYTFATLYGNHSIAMIDLKNSYRNVGECMTKGYVKFRPRASFHFATLGAGPAHSVKLACIPTDQTPFEFMDIADPEKGLPT